MQTPSPSGTELGGRRTRQASDRPSGIPLWSRQDLVMLIRLPVGTVLAWGVPERFWPQLGRAVAGFRARVRRDWAAREQAHIGGFLGEHGHSTAEGVLREQVAHQRVAQLQTLRAHRPGAGIR